MSTGVQRASSGLGAMITSGDGGAAVPPFPVDSITGSTRRRRGVFTAQLTGEAQSPDGAAAKQQIQRELERQIEEKRARKRAEEQAQLDQERKDLERVERERRELELAALEEQRRQRAAAEEAERKQREQIEAARKKAEVSSSAARAAASRSTADATTSSVALVRANATRDTETVGVAKKAAASGSTYSSSTMVSSGAALKSHTGSVDYGASAWDEQPLPTLRHAGVATQASSSGSVSREHHHHASVDTHSIRIETSRSPLPAIAEHSSIMSVSREPPPATTVSKVDGAAPATVLALSNPIVSQTQSSSGAAIGDGLQTHDEWLKSLQQRISQSFEVAAQPQSAAHIEVASTEQLLRHSAAGDLLAPIRFSFEDSVVPWKSTNPVPAMTAEDGNAKEVSVRESGFTNHGLTSAMISGDSAQHSTTGITGFSALSTAATAESHAVPLSVSAAAGVDDGPEVSWRLREYSSSAFGSTDLAGRLASLRLGLLHRQEEVAVDLARSQAQVQELQSAGIAEAAVVASGQPSGAVSKGASKSAGFTSRRQVVRAATTSSAPMQRGIATSSSYRSGVVSNNGSTRRTAVVEKTTGRGVVTAKGSLSKVTQVRATNVHATPDKAVTEAASADKAHEEIVDMWGNRVLMV
jgi:hypothetical protein